MGSGSSWRLPGHIESNRAEIVRLEMQKGRHKANRLFGEQTLLHYAAQRGLPDMAKVLIEGGVLVDNADRNGWTALCRAVANGHLDVVRVLVESGATVQGLYPAKDVTLLDLAVLHGHYDIALYIAALPINPVATLSPQQYAKLASQHHLRWVNYSVILDGLALKLTPEQLPDHLTKPRPPKKEQGSEENCLWDWCCFPSRAPASSTEDQSNRAETDRPVHYHPSATCPAQTTQA